MIFHSFSKSSDQALAKFNRINEHEIIYSTHRLSEMIPLCDYEIFLIAPETPIPERLQDKHVPSTIISLSKAWQDIVVNTQQMYTLDNGWKKIKSIGHVAMTGKFMGNIGQTRNAVNLRTTLWRSSTPSNSNYFFIFLTGNEEHGLHTYDIRFLCNLWQIERGCLPVHAAAVIRGNGVYLFAGASGAGKSTVAALSQSVGGHAFEEDQVSLRPLNKEYFTADAWGYNVEHCNMPLRAVFLLKQAKENRLNLLSQSQVTHFLIQRHYEALGLSLSDSLIQKSFPIAARAARSVPGYELFFTKSPDFWDLIDAKLSD